MSNHVYRQAEQARDILENVFFVEALRKMTEFIVREWQAEGDAAKRDILFYRQRAITEVRNEFLSYIDQAAVMDAKADVENSQWREIYNKLINQEYQA